MSDFLLAISITTIPAQESNSAPDMAARRVWGFLWARGWGKDVRPFAVHSAAGTGASAPAGGSPTVPASEGAAGGFDAAWLGVARRGRARRGRHGAVRQGEAWPGKAGAEWHRVARHGVAWLGTAGKAWRDAVWQGLDWSG